MKTDCRQIWNVFKSTSNWNPLAKETVMAKRVLEINPKHPIIEKLNELNNFLFYKEELEKEKAAGRSRKTAAEEEEKSAEKSDEFEKATEGVEKRTEGKIQKDEWENWLKVRNSDITWLLYDMSLLDSGFTLEQLDFWHLNAGITR